MVNSECVLSAIPITYIACSETPSAISKVVRLRLSRTKTLNKPHFDVNTAGCVNNRSFLPVCFPRLWNQLPAPSVNHTLIPSMLHHSVLWVALPPSVPSTHHFHHPLPLHSFTPYFPFLQILPTIAYLFFFRTDTTDSPDCLPILLSISIFTL